MVNDPDNQASYLDDSCLSGSLTFLVTQMITEYKSAKVSDEPDKDPDFVKEIYWQYRSNPRGLPTHIIASVQLSTHTCTSDSYGF